MTVSNVHKSILKRAVRSTFENWRYNDNFMILVDKIHFSLWTPESFKIKIYKRNDIISHLTSNINLFLSTNLLIKVKNFFIQTGSFLPEIMSKTKWASN